MTNIEQQRPQDPTEGPESGLDEERVVEQDEEQALGAPPTDEEPLAGEPAEEEDELDLGDEA